MNASMPLFAEAWQWPQFFNNEDIIVPLVLFTVIGIVATVVPVTRMLIRHRERMAMIERGMHPDYPPEQSDHPQNPT